MFSAEKKNYYHTNIEELTISEMRNLLTLVFLGYGS